MRNFLFMLGAAAGDLVAIASIKLYQSADGQAGWVEVDAIAIGALVDDPTGKKRWDSAAADPTQYAKLVAVSVSGVERPDGILLPPLPADPNTFTVFVHTIDAGMGIEEGVSFSAGLVGSHAKAGQKLVVRKATQKTDAEGYAALKLPADAGTLQLALSSVSANVDTAGRTGQVINFKDLL